MYIAEQNMAGVALGLSRRGKIPFASTFAAFWTRAFDQIRMSRYSDANIKFVGSHAGVSIGPDGPSQMGLEDIAMFRTLLDSVVLHPCDAVSTEKLVEEMARQPGIAYLRTLRQETPILYDPDESFPIGGSKVLRKSDHDAATIVAAGATVHEALAAYEELRKEGIAVRVIDLYCIQPVDEATLRAAARETPALITVEDHYAAGGLGEAVLSALAGSGGRRGGRRGCGRRHGGGRQRGRRRRREGPHPCRPQETNERHGRGIARVRRDRRESDRRSGEGIAKLIGSAAGRVIPKTHGTPRKQSGRPRSLTTKKQPVEGDGLLAVFCHKVL